MNNLIKITIGSVLGITALSLYMRTFRKENPPIFYPKGLPFGYNGFVVPPFGVFIREKHKESKELLLHELVHWQQYQREGMLPFLFNYTSEALTKGYDKNPYEIEARYNESDFCKENYTHCVKNGLAKTVHNPDFRNT
jgi:hypothetical protein